MSFWPRTTHILTHGTDKILKFLASTILTGFWRSGINIPDIPQTERKFLENVNASPGDIIENFYHHEQTKKDQQTNQATQACNLLQSLHIDGNTLVIGPIAALLSANALTLLYAVDATAGRCFDYLEIPLGAILEVSPLTIESMSTLVLTLDSSVMTVNGPDDVLQGQKLRLTSKESLKDLETAIHAAAESRRCGVREGILVTRKASSTLISLDLRDEIVRKSAGPNDIGRDMDPDHESHTVANGQSAGHVAFVSGTTCNEAVVQGDQSQTVSANAITIVHQDNVPGNSEVGSSPSRGHQEQSQRPMGQAKAMCTEDQIESLSETEGKPDAQKVQNADAFQINRVPENVIEKSDQNVRRNLPYQLRSLSSKTKPPARFTNTQESLMFHRRKPGQKVYTSHSKAAVDWDEDLRQSSDNLDGTVEKETITSISSPFPGDGSIFDRRTSTAKRKRDPVGKASSKKKRKTNPRPRKKDVGTTAPGDEQSRASRQDKAEREADDAEWSSADDAQTGHSGSKSEENHDPLTNHDQRHIERGGLNTAQYTLTTLKATDAHNMTELIKDSTGSDKGADIAVEENVGVGNATDKTSHEEHKDSLATNEYGPGGRGKAVGRKLTAAFKDFDTQGNEGSFEQRVCDEAAHSIPLSAPDEGVESVHSTELSRIHQYSTQRLEPTIPRSPCWNTMVSQSPRSSMRTESNELDNPAQSTVFFDPTHIEMSRIGGSRPRSEVKQWKISISAGGKSRNTTSEEDGRRDLKDAARRRSLPRDLRRIPAPILQSSSTPKRMMVDKNGSPQMIRRGATACTTLQESSIQSKVGMRMKPVQLVFQGQGKGNESGYDGGSETDATEEAPERDGHVSSSPLCYHSPAHPLLERAAAPAGTLEGLDIDQVVQTDSKSTCELLETAHKRTQSMLLASSQVSHPLCTTTSARVIDRIRVVLKACLASCVSIGGRKEGSQPGAGGVSAAVPPSARRTFQDAGRTDPTVRATGGKHPNPPREDLPGTNQSVGSERKNGAQANIARSPS